MGISLNLNIYQTLAAAIIVYYVGVFLRVKLAFSASIVFRLR